MEVSGVGQYRAMQNSCPVQKAGTAPQTAEQKAVSANMDTVSLSGGAEYLKGLQEQFPRMAFSVGNGFAGKTKMIERVREKNKEAADKLEELLNKAEETGELTLGDEEMRWLGSAAKSLEARQKKDDADDEEAGGESGKSSGCVGINAQKLARMLAAAKTRSQVQAIIAQIQSDLRECDAGREQGMDVDEASYSAAEQLLQQARQQLGQAENREATPEEEMASALASLM